jgi:hypothetical protein
MASTLMELHGQRAPHLVNVTREAAAIGRKLLSKTCVAAPGIRPLPDDDLVLQTVALMLRRPVRFDWQRFAHSIFTVGLLKRRSGLHHSGAHKQESKI